MAALLGAAKGGQDLPQAQADQTRGDLPFRNGNSSNGVNGINGGSSNSNKSNNGNNDNSGSSNSNKSNNGNNDNSGNNRSIAAPAAASSATANSLPRTPTSSDGQAQPTTPSSAAAASAASPQLPAAAPTSRKTTRLSRGPSALTPVRGAGAADPEQAPTSSPRPQQQQSQQQQQQQSLQSPQAQSSQQPTSATSVQSSSASANTSSIDPLSQHIFLRTNTDPVRNSKLRSYTPASDSPGPDASSPTADISQRFSSPTADVGKEKKKGFLGRLSMRSGRKKEDASDLASEAGEPRDEGSNAHVFSSIVDSAGFIPHHKEPPRYIRVKLHNKKTKDFDRMFLAQELIGTRPLEGHTDSRVTVSTAGQGRKKTATGGAVWATEFSKDGKYLAAGGRDHVVRIWQVISTAEDRRRQEEEEAQDDRPDERLSAPVFLEKPVQEFKGHTGEILDLSWSKNNFLLSTSMDKTVRLWHTSREECLCTFKHKELVSKVAFHPKDDRFFLAGCLDATLRLWSIPDKTVAFSAQLSDMITAVAFSPDGKMAIAGLLSGFCYLLETEGLKPLTQIHVRSSRGRNAKGSKITGITPMVLPNARPGDAAILVTSTDARVRLYNMRDKTLDCKFKGHEHASGQLSASFSDDGKYVICGSEAKKVFIWNVTPSDSITKDRYPCETFDAHGDMVTTAIFAPVQTRQLLGASGDPIYDLCNPPPIQLMSLEETLASQSGMSNNTLNHNEDGTEAPTSPPHPPPRARPEESPAYIARSTHYDGNIIVTSDDTGIIKVFRQDCAAKKRKHESWETGSNFGQKLGGSRIVGRSGSIITRTSASSAAHSRRGSLSLPTHLAGGAGSSPQIGGNPDSINRWRHGIEGGSSRPNSLIGTAPVRSERSISPNKSSRTSLGAATGLASDARKQPYAATTSSPLSPHFAPSQVGRSGMAASATMSPTSAAFAPSARQPGKSILNPASTSASGDHSPVRSAAGSPASAAAKIRIQEPTDVHEHPDLDFDHDGHDLDTESEAEPETEYDIKPVESLPPTMAYRSDQLRLDPAGASFGFWNLNRWKGIAGLRTSLIGSGSGSSSNNNEPTSPVDAVHSDKGGEGGAETKPAHSRRRSLGVNLLPKSPLSKSDTLTTGEGDSSLSPVRPGQSRQKSSGARSSLLSPAITIATEDGDVRDYMDPRNTGGDSTHLMTPGSRSHSPYATRTGSIVSRLSSEMTSTDGEGELGDGAPGDDGDEMRCTKCGGREFKARRVAGVQQLQCSRCGKVLEERK